MDQWRKKTYARFNRSRLPVYFTFVVLLVILTLIMPIYWVYTDKLKNQISQMNESFVEQVRSTFDSLLQEVDRTAVRLAESERVNRFIFQEKNRLFNREEDYQLSLKELFRALSDEVKFHGNISGIYIYVPATSTVLTSDSVMPLAAFPDRTFIRSVQASGDSKGWSGARLSNTRMIGGYASEEEVITFHHALSKDGLVNDAMLFIDVRMSLFKQLDKLGSSYPIALIITSEDGSVVFSESELGQSPTLATGEQAKSSVTSARSAYNGWRYTVIIPKYSLFAPMQFISRITVVLAAGALLSGLLASLYFSRRFHKPLELALARWRKHPDGGSAEGTVPLDKEIHTLVQSTLGYADVLAANRGTIHNAMLLNLLKNNEWPPDDQTAYSLKRDAAFYQVITCVRDQKAELNAWDKGMIQLTVHSRVREAFAQWSCGMIELAVLDDYSFCIVLFGSLHKGSDKAAEQAAVLDGAERAELLDEAEQAAVLDEVGDALLEREALTGGTDTEWRELEQADLLEEEQLLTALSTLQAQLASYDQFAWTFGIGNRYTADTQVNASYRESLLAAQHRIYKGKGNLIFFRDLQVDDSRIQENADEWMKYKDKIVAGIRAKDWPAVALNIEALGKWIERTPHSLRDRSEWNRIHYIGFSVFTEIEKLIYELNVDREAIYPNERSFATLAENSPTAIEMQSLLLDTCERLIAYLEAKPSTAKASFVQVIADYIHQCYGEQQMSLESTAERFGMNASYLGQLLKKELNKTFLQLLSEVRVEQAKRLLGNPAVQIQDVAEQVGYGSRSTFIRVFKASTGVTPSDYRNALLLESQGAVNG